MGPAAPFGPRYLEVTPTAALHIHQQPAFVFTPLELDSERTRPADDALRALTGSVPLPSQHHLVRATRARVALQESAGGGDHMADRQRDEAQPGPDWHGEGDIRKPCTSGCVARLS